MTINDIISNIIEKHKEKEFTLFPPATLSQITEFEKVMGAPLPEDIRQFYLFSNGLDTMDFLFRIIPLEEIMKNNFRLALYQFSFAEYMIYSDTWQVQLDPQDQTVYWIRNELVIHPLTRSMADFLDAFLTNGLFGSGGIYDRQNELFS